MSNVIYPGTPEAPNDWNGVNTTFGDIGLDTPPGLKQFRAAHYIQQHALLSHASVIVFPESVITMWTEATDLFWKPTLAALASRGKTVLIGAGINIDGSEKYQNALIIRGAHNTAFVQRIPIPLGMWNPFSNRGVRLQLEGPDTVDIHGRRIAPLICYEQFLTWPVLRSMASRADLLLGVSNHHWAHSTRIPTVQKKMFLTWTRLFRIPYLLAANS